MPQYDFRLPGVDGRDHSLEDYKDFDAVAVVFTCNHCPYALSYENRLRAHGDWLDKAGVKLVAICSNDASRYPQDSFENMQRRATDNSFRFPYLHDESQEVARNYGATRTPHAFLIRRKGDGWEKVYEGLIDDNWEREADVERRYLLEAAHSLAEGKLPDPAETQPIGCTIKWKE